MLRSNDRAGWVLGMVAVLALGLTPAISAPQELFHPEDTRDALRTLMRSFDRLGAGSHDTLRQSDRARRSLEQLDAAQLEALHGVFEGRPELLAAMDSVNDAAARLAGEIEFLPGEPAPGTLADPVYSTLCGALRVDAQTASDQLDLWEMMQVAAIQAQGLCDAGADPANDCAAAATAREMAAAARFVYEASLLCWRDIDSAELAATLASVGEVDAAITGLGDAIDTSLSTLGDTLQMEHADLLAEIVATQDAVATESAAIQSLVSAESAALQQAIADLGAAIDSQFQAVLANQQMLLDQQQLILNLLVTPQGRRPGWNGRLNGPGTGNNGNGNGNP